MVDDELMPRDPNLDDLPDELRLHPGPLFIDGMEVTRENLAAAFADESRAATRLTRYGRSG
jgi:hypothetical protein